MDDEFMELMDEMREELGFPFIVSSAYRCPDHNDAISTTGRDGPHTTGRAIDIAVDRENAYLLLALAFAKGFTGIGVKQKGSGRFIHLDTLTPEESLRPTIWSY